MWTISRSVTTPQFASVMDKIMYSSIVTDKARGSNKRTENYSCYCNIIDNSCFLNTFQKIERERNRRRRRRRRSKKKKTKAKPPRRPSHASCTLLGCYSARSGNFLPTFRENPSVPSSGGSRTQLK